MLEERVPCCLSLVPDLTVPPVCVVTMLAGKPLRPYYKVLKSREDPAFSAAGKAARHSFAIAREHGILAARLALGINRRRGQTGSEQQDSGTPK